jgi:hypothetical protein
MFSDVCSSKYTNSMITITSHVSNQTVVLAGWFVVCKLDLNKPQVSFQDVVSSCTTHAQQIEALAAHYAVKQLLLCTAQSYALCCARYCDVL